MKVRIVGDSNQPCYCICPIIRKYNDKIVDAVALGKYVRIMNTYILVCQECYKSLSIMESE